MVESITPTNKVNVMAQKGLSVTSIAPVGLVDITLGKGTTAELQKQSLMTQALQSRESLLESISNVEKLAKEKQEKTRLSKKDKEIAQRKG